MRSRIAFTLLACSTGVLSAQSLSGPIEGFTFDEPTQTLRAVNGVPGSATLGPAVLGGIEFGTAAPYRNYGFAFKNGRGLLVSGLDSAHVSTAEIRGIFGRPEGAVWSGDGAHLVLFSRSGRWIQTLAGMPAAPRANPYLDLSVLGGLLCDVAIHSPANEVAIAMCGRGAGVYLNTPSQQLVPLPRMLNPVAVAFSENGASLYVVDAGARKLAIVRLSDSTSEEFPLAGLKTPFAIRAGHDASNQPLVYVASRSDRILGIYSPSNQKMVEKLQLSFEPTGIQEFGRDSFVIATRVESSDPMWLFTTTPKPAVYFVPASHSDLKGAE